MEGQDIGQIIVYAKEAVEFCLIAYIAFLVSFSGSRDSKTIEYREAEPSYRDDPPALERPIPKRAPVYNDEATAAYIETKNKRPLPPA